MRYLSCPQCGVKIFYVSNTGGKVFFHVNGEKIPVPALTTRPSDLEDLDFTRIHCKSCSWSGPISALKTLYYR